jgi:hypothetical protein
MTTLHEYWCRSITIAALLTVLAAGVAAEDGDDDDDLPFKSFPVPQELQGSWAPAGQCGDPNERMIIGEDTMRWNNGINQPVVYRVKQFPGWPGSIHFQEEYVVSFYGYDDEEPDALVFFQEGFNYPKERFERCR